MICTLLPWNSDDLVTVIELNTALDPIDPMTDCAAAVVEAWMMEIFAVVERPLTDAW